VADRAAVLLAEWEAGRSAFGGSERPAPARFAAEERAAWDTEQPGAPDGAAEMTAAPDPGTAAALALAAELRSLDLDGLTPREALAWVWAQRDRLANTPKSSPEQIDCTAETSQAWIVTQDR
jgi:hypothetical protein